MTLDERKNWKWLNFTEFWINWRCIVRNFKKKKVETWPFLTYSRKSCSPKLFAELQSNNKVFFSATNYFSRKNLLRQRQVVLLPRLKPIPRPFSPTKKYNFRWLHFSHNKHVSSNHFRKPNCFFACSGSNEAAPVILTGVFGYRPQPGSEKAFPSRKRLWEYRMELFLRKEDVLETHGNWSFLEGRLFSWGA